MKENTNLSTAHVRDILTSALKTHTADYCDIRFEEQSSAGIAYRGKEVDQSSSNLIKGGIVRACIKGGWGYAVFNDLERAASCVKEACSGAALAKREKTELAEVPVIQKEFPTVMKGDFRDIPFDEKLSFLTRINKELLTFDDTIQTTRTSYSENFRTVYFVSSSGTWYMEERPYATAAIAATAGKNGIIQNAHESIRTCIDYREILELEDLIETVGKRSVDLLSAPPAKGGTYPVILNQLLGGIFIHEAFGHLSEADFLSENSSMREIMKPGRKLGPKFLQVSDDGTFENAAGSHAVDDEGTPVSRVELIKNGEIKGFLHSRETAGQMGMQPTGNARAIRGTVQPIVRMRNTVIENGTEEFNELIGDIDDGYYACNAFGGQTAMEQFTFSAGYGYRIKKGKIDRLVRDLVLTGNVFETLDNIDALGNDFILTRSGGGCGKNGQSPLPVSFGAPHVRIQNVVVGGK